MAQRFGRGVRHVIVLCPVLLGPAVSACDRTSVSVTWVASGTEVTRLQMPLNEYGSVFIIGAYALEGREDFVRPFRDRVLLTIHAQGVASHVLGYIARTYDSGQVRTLRLGGTERRATQDSKTMVVTGWAYSLGPAAAGRYPVMAWIELRLDSASGRILATGSSHGPHETPQVRTDSGANAAFPKSPPIR
jgi:hypothetical protein